MKELLLGLLLTSSVFSMDDVSDINTRSSPDLPLELHIAVSPFYGCEESFDDLSPQLDNVSQKQVFPSPVMFDTKPHVISEAATHLRKTMLTDFNLHHADRLKQNFRRNMIDRYVCYIEEVFKIDDIISSLAYENMEYALRLDIQTFVARLQMKLMLFSRQYQKHPCYNDVIQSGTLLLEHSLYESITIERLDIMRHYHHKQSTLNQFNPSYEAK